MLTSLFAVRRRTPSSPLSYRDEDILVPVTVGMHDWPPLHYFPWTQKIDRAVFRGREYCHTRGFAYAKDVCSRTYMAHMTQVGYNIITGNVVMTQVGGGRVL